MFHECVNNPMDTDLQDLGPRGQHNTAWKAYEYHCV